MVSYYSITHSPRRLSERRGIPELQPLEPAPSSKPLATSRLSLDSELCRPISQGSSVNTAYSFDNTPITPVEMSPFRSDVMSPITAPPSIREEDEEDDYAFGCNCGKTLNESGGVRGLGFEIPTADGLNKQTMAWSLTERLHVATGSNGLFNPDQLVDHHKNNSSNNSNSNMCRFFLPPTPPSHAAEVDFDYPDSNSLMLRSQKSGELVIDPECFSSGPPPVPYSPTTESSRSRAASILNKVVPSKLRASLKRRMSSPISTQLQIPPIPSVATMPKSYSAGTPPEDGFDAFFRMNNASMEKVTTPDDPIAMHCAAEAEAPLPPPLHPAATFAGESNPTSPLHSPRFLGYPGFPVTDVFPEMKTCHSPIPLDVISSPLYPPTISPLMSPSIASASQISLNTPPTPMHKKVPSIDPATPLAPKKMTPPLTIVTADSLADMIEEMYMDLNGYDATRARMVESGWSSPQMIRNVELQREGKEREWKERIEESKKKLQDRRRYEVKHSAMSSMSSIDSFPTTASSPMSPITPATSFAGGSGDFPSMKGF